MGVMLLLVFTPVPCGSLRRMGVPRQAAACVGRAAGMMVEAALAALALVVWINAEPGLVRTAAYNTIFSAGVSTVLFNLNPLLPSGITC